MNISDLKNFSVKGFQGTSVLDFPERIACIIFTGGCNLVCPYCHNSEIAQNPHKFEDIPLTSIFEQIKARTGFIDGIVITGGEPTLQKDLPLFCGLIKENFRDLEIKVDTNGMSPEIISGLLNNNLINMLALDIKTCPDNYEIIPGGSSKNFINTLKIMQNSDIEKEYRITCYKDYTQNLNYKKIKKYLNKGDKIYLQKCLTADSSGPDTGLSHKEALDIQNELSKTGVQVFLRGF